MNYDYINDEILRLEKEIQKIECELETMPPGDIYCCHNGKYTKWYYSDGHSSTHIPIANKDYIQTVIKKKYLKSKQFYLSRELKNLRRLQKEHLNNKDTSIKLLSDSAYQPFLLSVLDSSNECSNWAHEKYFTNPLFPEKRIYPCKSGHMVRSKSEMMIANSLYEAGLFFRYECELRLGDITLYPDFMILHPVTKTIYIWEHFGLINQHDYLEKATEKLKRYISNNYLPNVQLIITFESESHPFSFDEIEKNISHFFKIS